MGNVFAYPIGSRVAHTLRSDGRTHCGKLTPGWRLTLAGADGMIRTGGRGESLSACAKCLEALAAAAARP
jgi:hypothetical protein